MREMTRADKLYEEALERFNAVIKTKGGLDAVAAELDFSVSMCSHVRGRTKRPSLTMAAAIQEKYGIPAVNWAPRKRRVA